MDSEASKQLVEHFRRGGWLPISQKVLNDWLVGALTPVYGDAEAPLLPVIQDFKMFIENNGEMYMGFNRMFENATGPYVCNTRFTCGTQQLLIAPPLLPTAYQLHSVVAGFQ